MKITPLGNRILVKNVVIEIKTTSGILLDGATPEEAESYFGEVVVLGDGPKITDMNLEVGQQLVTGKFAGDKFEINQNGKMVEYRILDVDLILGLIEN